MENRNSEQIARDMKSIPSETIVHNQAGKVLESTMDSTEEINQVIEMTPKEGFDLKIGLIAEADDMSTREKLDAIDAAESKYSKDMKDNAGICRKMSWSKAGVIFLLCVGGGILISSPTVRKVALSA